MTKRRFVLDCSVAMGWCFLDEVGAYAADVLESFAHCDAIVPQIWPLEVANALVTGQRRNRLQPAERLRFVRILQALHITVDVGEPRRILDAVVETALAHGLSAYDASYVDLAMREGLPLATLDSRLRTVAGNVGVSGFLP